MKITDILEKVVEGDPKICNDVYINISNENERKNWLQFEEILYSFAKSDKVKVIGLAENECCLYTYEMKLSAQRKFVSALRAKDLDLVEKSHTVMKLIKKE